MNERRYAGMKDRCTNKNNAKYHRYGGRGIQVKMTLDELNALWVRDGAKLMKSPTIDRINNDGHYEISNCRFIENEVNASRRKKSHCPHGHEYSGANLIVRINKKGRYRVCKTCERNKNIFKSEIRHINNWLKKHI